MTPLITFEGIEGSGKSTQVRRLADALRRQGRLVLVTREPGGCPIADAIRRILLDPASENLVPAAELLLYAAARAQHVAEVIRPALQAGKIVLCDRFSDATVSYQGFGRGLDAVLIAELNGVATAGLVPSLTLLLDLAPERGLQRARQRNHDLALASEERFERESLEFHRRVRAGYRSLAEKEQRIRVVDAEGSEEVVAERILAIVNRFLAGDAG